MGGGSMDLVRKEQYRLLAEKHALAGEIEQLLFKVNAEKQELEGELPSSRVKEALKVKQAAAESRNRQVEAAYLNRSSAWNDADYRNIVKGKVEAAEMEYSLAVAEVEDTLRKYQRKQELVRKGAELEDKVIEVLAGKFEESAKVAHDEWEVVKPVSLPTPEDKGRFKALAQVGTSKTDEPLSTFVPPSVNHPALNGARIRGMNLGGWLIAEKWLKPSLWDGMPDVDLTDGAEVQLRCSITGNYVGAEGGGGGQVNANEPVASRNDTFRLWRLGEGKYNFRAQNAQFVTAIGGGGGAVSAIAMAASDWETFRIIRNGDDPNRVQVKSFSGHWLQANDGQLNAACEQDPGWNDGPAVFIMSANPTLQGTFQLCNGWGPEKAKEILEAHWSTFITEDDFDFMAKNGINTVRIPIGWWLTREEGGTPWPYVPGAAGYLDKAFEWAQKHGLLVMIDFHAAPGSQNGWDHGGTRDGSIEWGKPGTSYVQDSLDAIDWLAKKYCKHPALLGIQVLNEPRRLVPVDTIKQYYVQAYHIIRSYSPTASVLINCQIDGDPMLWGGFMGDTELYHNVLLDVGHWYAAWLPPGNDAAYYVAFMYTVFLPRLMKLARANPNVPVLLGEWSMDMKATPSANDVDWRNFGYAQVQCWAQATGGWFFFNLKLDTPYNSDGWNFYKSVENKWLDPQMFALEPPQWPTFPVV
eukprot:jgi/Mesen1/556/ME000105S10731